MAHVIYRCPATGQRMELWLVEEKPTSTPATPRVRGQCPAGGHTHLVNPATGIAGDRVITASVAS